MKTDIFITDLCDKYDISRHNCYDWKNEIENSAKDSWNHIKVGCKSKGDVSPSNYFNWRERAKNDQLKEKSKNVKLYLQWVFALA